MNIGDQLPNTMVWTLDNEGKPTSVSARDLVGTEGTSVLVGVPAAFSPTCHNAHIPGYVRNAAPLAERGVNKIVVLAVNDFFTMDAWMKALNAPPSFTVIADNDAHFTKIIDMGIDLGEHGLGTRCRRFAAVLKNGVVKHVADESGVGLNGSSAEGILKHI